MFRMQRENLKRGGLFYNLLLRTFICYMGAIWKKYLAIKTFTEGIKMMECQCPEEFVLSDGRH